MKRALILTASLACLGGGLLIWWQVGLKSAVALKMDKVRATAKYAKDEEWFSHVPSTSPTNIAPAADSSSTLSAEVSSCTISLPKSLFPALAQSTNGHAQFTNDDLAVSFLGTLDKTNFTTLEHALGCTNVFDLITSAYRTTVAGISEQKNEADLQRYLGLMDYKFHTAPAGCDIFWLPFDRGDFKGSISGDLLKDGKVAVEIYLKEKDEFMAVLIRRRNGSHDLSDVCQILSVLRITALTAHGSLMK